MKRTATAPPHRQGTATARTTRPLALISTLILVLAGLTSLVGARPAHADAVSITVDGTSSGRVFDGVGAISAGGGNSRLLIDYPEPQRTQLLDYLFKPGYGAALQGLKIEVGGDTNSSDGSQPSHEHTRGVVDCHQGNEWWLAQQAKTRNPDLKLAALSEGAPGWIGVDDPNNPNPGHGYFWSTDEINYLMDWLGCAKQNGLTIDYLGGWDERGYDKGWYENLKAALVSHGYPTKVIADDDNTWRVGEGLAADPAFSAAVDIVAVHYPCGWNSDSKTCYDPSQPGQQLAIDSGKTMWDSEGGTQPTDEGATAVARSINREYIDGRITSYWNWPAIAALYPNLPWNTAGMSIANQPWSGNYHIGKTTWVTAHTTQFAQPGWQYLDSASGYLGGDRSNGSYVSRKSPNNSDYSTVIETIDASAAQTLSVNVAGGLSTGTVHVWATNLNSSNSADYFVNLPDITPSGGSYSLTLQPGYVYTLTTTTGQSKGDATSPPAAPLALPYSDNFQTPAASTSPKYFSDMNGSFNTVSCGGGRTGTCLRQMAPTEPIRWTGENYDAPYTIIGDNSWSDYTVTSDVMLEQSGSVELLGRVGEQKVENHALDAYHLYVSDTGAWSIKKSYATAGTAPGPDDLWAFTELASGTATALGTGSWHTIAFGLQGSTLTASIDGTVVGQATDSSYSTGLTGLGVAGYQTDQFSNFSVTAGS
ncbi:hypothetical protein ABIA35_003498 [Catenulispora sp. MAP12-49]|uniref:galactosylceramidase n=1 Tax=Catenulispora sp. MAP12-49 TaxID=3156302 RepID=UPI0035183477